MTVARTCKMLSLALPAAVDALVKIGQPTWRAIAAAIDLRAVAGSKIREDGLGRSWWPSWRS